MSTHASTVSSQGQLTVPVNIRQILGITAGSVLVWEVTTDHMGLPAVVVKAGTVSNLRKLRGAAKKMYAQRSGGGHVLETERAAWE